MKAVVVESDGDLSWGEIDAPAVTPGTVRISVHTTAVNRADLLQRRGLYPPPPGASEILGLECAGVISACGPGVSGFEVGDRVCALLAGGGYAEQVVCPSAQVLALPTGTDLVTAAALPEVMCTAFMVLDDGAAQPGESLLIHAGASGVGTALIQIAAARGLRTFVTTSGSKLDLCTSLGAEGGVDRHAGPWLEAVRAWAPEGVDVVVDPVGAPYLADDQRALAVGGRLVVLGLMGGRKAELDLGRLLVKRQRVMGTVLRSRSPRDKARIVAGVRHSVWPQVEAGQVRPVIDSVVPITEVAAAHEKIASNRTAGKVLLQVATG